MALNNAQDAIIDDRRRLVASLILRKRTQREIVRALEGQGQRNPDNGQPWSLGTINADVQTLRKQWRKEAKQAISEHKARQFAELNEVMKQGWVDNDLSSILRAIKQQAELLGLDAPVQNEQISVGMTLDEWEKRQEENRRQVDETMGLFDDEVETQDTEGSLFG